MTANDTIVSLTDVRFSYGGEAVLEAADLTIKSNEFAWIVGPNGGGKTTLVKILLGLLKPQRGQVSIFGASPLAARRRIGYMPQHAQLDLGFPVTAMDVAMMGRCAGGVKMGPYSLSDRKATMHALDLVGLSDRVRTPLASLSGGQQRRLLIARALASEPELLILDEPTANLDRQVERELFNILRMLNKTLTIIMVSHDPAFVSDFVEHVICVNRNVAVHPTTAVLGESMIELYGAPTRMVRHDRHTHEGGDR